MTQVDYVVSVAAKQTLEVWGVTAQMLLKYLPATTYEVIVPACDVELFREKTPSAIAVSPETDYIRDFAEPLREMLGEKNERFGWYLQQFIKLEAIRRNSHLQRIVIWDADTVALGPLALFDKEGTPIFYRGEENHTPYFDNIRALFGLERTVDFSFVAQCMPMTGQWVSEFFGELEQRHNVSWWQAIIQHINPQEASGFSEYETLGTFLNDRFGPLKFQHGQWSRRGYHHYSSATDLLKVEAGGQLTEQLDFLAFEDWNRPRQKKSKKPLGPLTRLLRRAR